MSINIKLANVMCNMPTTLPPATPIKPLPQYNGIIDSIASGFIRGWVYSPETPNESIDFKVLLDGTELLQGSANLYREDLEHAGFGNGLHGYSCPHHLLEDKHTGQTLQLVSLDNQPIGQPFEVVSDTTSNITVNTMHLEDHLLLFSIEAYEDEKVTLQLFNNNTLFWQGVKTLKQGSNQLELPVCDELLDGLSHTITLGSLGSITALWQQSITLSINAVEIYRSTFNIDNKPIIVMIDRSVPKPDQDAGSYAAIQEASLLQALGFHIIFIPDDLIYSDKYTPKLQDLGIEVLYSPNFLNATHALLSVLPLACAVYITRYHYVEKYLKTIKSFSTELPIIFNNADLHFLREIRRANVLNDDVMRADAAKTRAREIKAMQSVDAILSYNEYEHAVITSHTLRSDNVHKCPWVVEVPDHEIGFTEREGVAFLGGYEHSPNVDAVEFFVEQVMPLLRKSNPDIKVYIYGSKMPDSFQKYANDDVILKGYIESLKDVYAKHRVFIAPLFFGAGVKGKVLDSAAYGLPCVLSPIAIEATGLVHKVSALVAENVEQWHDYVLRLYTNKAVWNYISSNEKEMIKDTYSFIKGKNMMSAILQSVGIEAPSK
jgi:glycosyltransferase involved in cell wall biosynthesis